MRRRPRRSRPRISRPMRGSPRISKPKRSRPMSSRPRISMHIRSWPGRSRHMRSRHMKTRPRRSRPRISRPMNDIIGLLYMYIVYYMSCKFGCKCKIKANYCFINYLVKFCPKNSLLDPYIFPRGVKGTGTRDLIWLKVVSLDRSWLVGLTDDH